MPSAFYRAAVTRSSCKMRAVVSVIVGLLAAAPASASEFRKAPYLQNPGPDRVTVKWETYRAVPGTVTEGSRMLSSPAGTVHEVVVDGLVPGVPLEYQVMVGQENLGGRLF